MRIHWWTRILDFVSPRLCVVCGRRLSPTERSLCAVCQLHLPRTAYQFSPDDNPMAQLFWHLAPVERAAALMYYEPHSEVARIVYQLKYNDRPDIGEDMGRVMACDMQLAGFFESIDVLLPSRASDSASVATTRVNSWHVASVTSPTCLWLRKF